MVKKLVVLGAVIVVLITVVVSKSKSTSSRNADQFAFGSSIVSSIEGVEIKAGSDVVHASLKSDVWVTGNNDYPADTAKINKILKVIGALQNKETVSRNPERSSEYGLDSATRKTVVLKGTGGNEFQRFFIGKGSSADFSSTFWKSSGSDDVYRTPGNISFDFNADPLEWVEKDLIQGEAGDVEEISVTWTDSAGIKVSYRLAKVMDAWSVVEPIAGPVKAEIIDEYTNRISQLSLDGFVLTPEDTLIGSGDPDVLLSFKLKGTGDVQMAAFKKDADHFLKHPFRSEVIRMGEWRLDLFKKHAHELFKTDTTRIDSAKVGAAG